MDLNLILYVSLVLAAYLTLAVAIYYVISLRGVAKQRKRFMELHSNLAAGQKIVLTGGIYGKIVSVNENEVLIDIGRNVTMTVSRFAISDIITSENV